VFAHNVVFHHQQGSDDVSICGHIAERMA